MLAEWRSSNACEQNTYTHLLCCWGSHTTTSHHASCYRHLVSGRVGAQEVRTAAIMHDSCSIRQQLFRLSHAHFSKFSRQTHQDVAHSAALHACGCRHSALNSACNPEQSTAADVGRMAMHQQRLHCCSPCRCMEFHVVSDASITRYCRCSCCYHPGPRRVHGSCAHTSYIVLPLLGVKLP